MEDPRIAQLQKEIENERNTSNSKYAFSGVGRSTDKATAEAVVGKKGVELIGSLTRLIDAELAYADAIKRGLSGKALAPYGDALSNAQSTLTGLKEQQTQRLKKLSTDILSASGKADLRMRYNNIFSKFKSRPEGRNYLKVKSVTPTRTKKYSLEARKQNIVPQRTISSIIKPTDKFGTRNLTGLKLK